MVLEASVSLNWLGNAETQWGKKSSTKINVWLQEVADIEILEQGGVPFVDDFPS